MRYNTLDILRFYAALSVTFYHLTFKIFPDHDVILEYSKYGMWGVEIFFIISGFVIIKSTSDRTPLEFVKRRITRLYPAYWLSLLYLLAVMILLDKEMDFTTLMANFTMFQEFLGFDHLNEVYWTLSFELVFYFYTFVFILCLRVPVDIFILGWIIMLTISKILGVAIAVKLFLGNYAIFFLFGVSLYNWMRNKSLRASITFIITFLMMLNSTLDLVHDYSLYLTRQVTFLGVATYLAIVIGLSLAARRTHARIAQYLGKISYPLYLVHSPSIWVVSDHYNGVLAFILSIFVIFSSSAVVLFAEEVVRKNFIKK